MPLRSSSRNSDPAKPGTAALATEEQVGGDVEAGTDGEVLVDGLDPAGPGVEGIVEERDLLAVHPQLAFVGLVGPGDAP